jgi:hypothetical protein
VDAEAALLAAVLDEERRRAQEGRDGQAEALALLQERSLRVFFVFFVGFFSKRLLLGVGRGKGRKGHLGADSCQKTQTEKTTNKQAPPNTTTN